LIGIGPVEHLNDLNISVIANLRVGDNLQDHVSSSIVFSLNESISLNMLEELSPSRILEYFVTKNNSLTSNLLEGVSFVKTKYANPSDDWPDVQLIMIPGIDKNLSNPILFLYLDLN